MKIGICTAGSANMKIYLLFIFIISFLATNANANVIGNDFLSADTGVRALAMGSAYTAVANDSNSIFYNAAGLGEIKSAALLTSYGNVFGMASKTHASLVVPVGGGAIGIGYIGLKVRDIVRTDDAGTVQGSFSYGDTAYLLGYGLNTGVDWLSLGIVGKYLVKECNGNVKRGLGIDISSLIITDIMNIGISIHDINKTAIGNDVYSSRIRAGMAIKPMKNVIVSTDYYEGSMSYGAEVSVIQEVSFQVGYVNDMVTMGCGLSVDSIKINVAYSKHDLGDSLKAEIGF
ncbi:MAG TPA: hypothetical protein DF296_01250 [Candidatus Margulisbacteria bacterium]|nr:MAG: hypothetical protein A2X43_13400 [Candidatus Margulisbacteria bacterium GWD2_39_127]HCT83809.1 hypothetical protein [Candidatus Margulisiibacteriota bacterium]